MDTSNDNVSDLLKKKFKVVKDGLDQDEVFSFISNLMDQNNELTAKLEHLDSLKKLAEKTVIEADKQAENIKLEIQEQAKAEAASTIAEAEEKARAEAEKIIVDAQQRKAKSDKTIAEAVESGRWDHVIDYVNREVFNKPEDYYTLDKLRKAAAVDRRLTLREILEKIFGIIPGFKSKDELLEEEFAKLVADTKPEESGAIPAIKTFFKAYIISEQVRHIIESGQFTDLATNPVFSTRDFRAVPERYRALIPEYVKDYIPLNQFTT